MADAIVEPGGVVPDSLNILRALNPAHLQEGLPGSQHFILNKDGISAGIEASITADQLRSLRVLVNSYGEGFAVAVLNVREVKSPPKAIPIEVIQEAAKEWEDFSHAHAVIKSTIHDSLSRKEREEFQRYLKKLARQRYYAQGSEEIRSAE